VGDVDFGAVPGAPAETNVAARSAARGSALPAYASLEGSRVEILAVRDSFERRFTDGRVRTLRGDQASEAAIRKEAGRHRWLHLATHGFFAPPSMRSALAPREDAEPGEMFARTSVTGFHPGLLSGLVLAGANRPVEIGQDDGILTAVEIAELDLGGVELAVLSACETGLGEHVAGGEGLQGLQRAFQVAGAKTVIASLWKLDDKATQQLMSRFYDNLWTKRLGKLEALRQAQLSMLRDELRGPGSTQPLDPAKKATAQRAGLPPFYWAGFVLSGNWR